MRVRRMESQVPAQGFSETPWSPGMSKQHQGRWETESSAGVSVPGRLLLLPVVSTFSLPLSASVFLYNERLTLWRGDVLCGRIIRYGGQERVLASFLCNLGKVSQPS